jgi:hypothetical protein
MSRGRGENDVRAWVESHVGPLDEPVALRKVMSNTGSNPFRNSGHATLRDSSNDLARGLDFGELETIPAEFEALLAFSEKRKI